MCSISHLVCVAVVADRLKNIFDKERARQFCKTLFEKRGMFGGDNVPIHLKVMAYTKVG